MERAVEFDPAFMARHPADRRLKRLEPVEPDPDALVDRGTFHELDLAAFRGGIEHPDSKTERAGAPDSDLGVEAEPGRAPVQERTGMHVLGPSGDVLRFLRSGPW